MSRPDFSRVWGSDNAPFTAIEASDYAAGWVFRTGAPPRRVNFDYFQNLSDQRTAWLGEQMLLAVGHEWQADVTYDAYAVTRSPVNGQLYRSLSAGNIGNEPSASAAQWALGAVDSKDFLNTTRIDVACASTVNLTTAAPSTRNIRLTGSTTVNQFTVAAGQRYLVQVGGSITIANSASIVTNSGANLSLVAGDSFEMIATAANVVSVLLRSRGIPQALGDGQAWQDVTASRVNNTNYTNTTGRSIMMIVVDNSVGAGSFTRITVDGLLISDFTESQGEGNETTMGSAVIPAGSVYLVSCQSGIKRWTELR